jgi:hypothetical protein
MMRPRFQDLACPQCGHRGDFHIDVTATAYVDANGPTVEGDYHWDGKSCCTCLGCGFEASAAEFTATKPEAVDTPPKQRIGGAL